MSPSSITLSQPKLTSQIAYLPSPSPPTHHIFFITGNPGCIAWYHDYLSTLSSHFSTHSLNINVYGASLCNFGTDDGSEELAGREKGGRLLSLQEQIEFVERRLEDYVAVHEAGCGQKEQKVIVVGHSVGAYIGLEILRRWRERVRGKEDTRLQIVGFIGLWPALTGLAKSRNGKILAVKI